MHVLYRGKTLHYTGAFVVYVESLCFHGHGMGTINDLLIYPYVGSSFGAAVCYIASSYNLIDDKLLNATTNQLCKHAEKETTGYEIRGICLKLVKIHDAYR